MVTDHGLGAVARARQPFGLFLDILDFKLVAVDGLPHESETYVRVDSHGRIFAREGEHGVWERQTLSIREREIVARALYAAAGDKRPVANSVPVTHLPPLAKCARCTHEAEHHQDSRWGVRCLVPLGPPSPEGTITICGCGG